MHRYLGYYFSIKYSHEIKIMYNVHCVSFKSIGVFYLMSKHIFDSSAIGLVGKTAVTIQRRKKKKKNKYIYQKNAAN